MSIRKLKNPILNLIMLASHLFTTVGVFAIMATGGSDDKIIEGLNNPDLEEMSVEEAIETTRSDLETVQKNQQRMYSLQRSTRSELKSLFYKGIGVLVTMMVALMGMMGTFLVILYQSIP